MAGSVKVRSNGVTFDAEVWNAQRSLDRVEALDAFGTTNLENDLLKKIGVAHRKQMRRQFATEGSSGGEEWEALDPAYARQKRAQFGNRKILVADGTMRGDATSESSTNYVQTIKKTGKRITISLGLDNRLANIHTNEGVLRRTDKPALSRRRRGGTKKRAKAARRSKTKRKAPQFTGDYELILRSVIQKTDDQVEELRDITRDYFHRRVFEPLATGLQLSEVPGS